MTSNIGSRALDKHKQLGFTELLKRGYGKSDTDGKKYLETIHSSGKHLLDIINDILDLSKIESGTVTIEVGEMPVNSLKQHMERTFTQVAADSTTLPTMRAGGIEVHTAGWRKRLPFT